MPHCLSVELGVNRRKEHISFVYTSTNIASIRPIPSQHGCTHMAPSRGNQVSKHWGAQTIQPSSRVIESPCARVAKCPSTRVAKHPSAENLTQASEHRRPDRRRPTQAFEHRRPKHSSTQGPEHQLPNCRMPSQSNYLVLEDPRSFRSLSPRT